MNSWPLGTGSKCGPGSADAHTASLLSPAAAIEIGTQDHVVAELTGTIKAGDDVTIPITVDLPLGSGWGVASEFASGKAPTLSQLLAIGGTDVESVFPAADQLDKLTIDGLTAGAAPDPFVEVSFAATAPLNVFEGASIDNGSLSFAVHNPHNAANRFIEAVWRGTLKVGSLVSPIEMSIGDGTVTIAMESDVISLSTLSDLTSAFGLGDALESAVPELQGLGGIALSDFVLTIADRKLSGGQRRRIRRLHGAVSV